VGPDGKSAVHQVDAVCYRGPIEGGPYNLYLSETVISVKAGPTDALGAWTYRMALKDNLRNIVLPLKTTFNIE